MAAAAPAMQHNRDEPRVIDDAALEDGFRRLAAAHRGAKRRYAVYAALLLGAGILLALLSQLTSLPSFWLLAVGVITACVSVFPFDQSNEHSERLEGLQVLREEWLHIRRQSPQDPTVDPRFLDIMRSLYSKQSSPDA